MTKARIPAKIKAAVVARDNYICRACGFGGSVAYAVHLDCDHIISESNGGKATMDNLQCLCGPCNRAKAGADYQFAIRVCNVPESVWSLNYKIVNLGFTTRDMAKTFRRLK